MIVQPIVSSIVSPIARAIGAGGGSSPVGYALPDLTAETLTYDPDPLVYPLANAFPASGFAIATGLTSININGFDFVAGQSPAISSLASLDDFAIINCPLATGNAPAPPANMTGSYAVRECPNITGYEGGDFPENVAEIEMDECGLTEAAIDAILQGCVDGGVNGIDISLDGGTNAPPSAGGLANIALLELDGCTVSVNS